MIFADRPWSAAFGIHCRPRFGLRRIGRQDDCTSSAAAVSQRSPVVPTRWMIERRATRLSRRLDRRRTGTCHAVDRPAASTRRSHAKRTSSASRASSTTDSSGGANSFHGLILARRSLSSTDQPDCSSKQAWAMSWGVGKNSGGIPGGLGFGDPNSRRRASFIDLGAVIVSTGGGS